VTCDPKGTDDGGAAELTERGDNGAAAQRWCGGGGPIGRRGHEAVERKGATECSGTRSRGRTEGKERGWCGGGGVPLIGDTAGGGGRVTGGTTQW
jgi:hypothetical protein